MISGEHRVLVAIVLSCGILWGCDGETPTGYFPLQSGLVWNYQVTVESREGSRNDLLTITNYGQIQDDEPGAEEFYIRGTSSGNYYYFSKRDDNVMRIAHRPIIDSSLNFDVPPRPVIKEPIAAGTQWEYIMRPYLLTSETEPHLKDSIRYKMNWEIISVDATIDTPLGVFDGCLHIAGKAEVAVPRSFLLHLAPHTMQFEIDEWYAPGVGLVKLRYAETTDSAELKGGSIDMDLIGFEF